MLTYKLKRSQRKTLAIRITGELEIVVYAPLRLNKTEIDAFVDKNQSWINNNLAKQRLYNQKHPPLSPAQIKELKEMAAQYIPPKVAFYSSLMELVPAAVKINQAKTRYGSCSGKNSLNFSCFLMQYPLEAIDYVVVHELAHIAYKNHSKDFYALVSSVLPDYQERRQLLKQ